MSKENLDDHEDNNRVDSTDDADDPWDNDAPAASSLLSTPSSDADDAADTTWDQGDSDTSVQTAVDDSDWDTGAESSPSDESGSDDDDDADDDDDGADDKTSSDAADGKKKSKAKSYLLIGGMSVFVAGILGAGVMLTQGGSGGVKVQPSPKPSMAITPEPEQEIVNEAVEPAQAQPARSAQSDQIRLEPVQQAEPITVQPEPVAEQPNVITPPAGLDLQMEPRIQERPIDQGIPETAPVENSVLSDLSNKTDMLATAITQVKERTDERIEQVQLGATETNENVSENEKRIIELEAQFKEMAAFIQELKEKQEKAKKPAPKKAAPKKAASPKPERVRKAEPAAQPVASAKPAAAVGVRGFSVVATYPSTTSPGVKPEKAWITNGEKLVQVVVGSVVNGAKVTGIEGTTVLTSHGVIRSPR